MSGKRPFRVRAWSNHDMDYIGGSFSTRGAAEARGVLFVQAGLDKVCVYEVRDGSTVLGTLQRVTLEDETPAATGAML